MYFKRVARILIVLFCLQILSVTGCGNSEPDEEVVVSNARVNVTMPDAVEGKVASKTFAADSKENSKIGEIISVEGIISIPSLAKKNSVKSMVVTIQFIWHRPNKVPTVANFCHGRLTSLGDNRYRYMGELKSPLKPDRYEMEILYGSKKVASKTIVVTK